MNTFLEFVSPHKYAPRTHQKFINVKVGYMYRDAGNYKLRNHQVFSNNHFLSICQVADFVLAAFIDKKWFDPELCGIEKLAFEEHDSDLDHEWHEIENVCLTNESTTLDIDIADFLFNAIKVHARLVEYSCKDDELKFDF